METDVDSVRAVTTETIEMETEMAADLAREDHRAARDVSEEKTEITVVKDALADRTTRVDSAPAVQEEAADLTNLKLPAADKQHPRTASVSVTERTRIKRRFR